MGLVSRLHFSLPLSEVVWHETNRIDKRFTSAQNFRPKKNMRYVATEMYVKWKQHTVNSLKLAPTNSETTCMPQLLFNSRTWWLIWKVLCSTASTIPFSKFHTSNRNANSRWLTQVRHRKSVGHTTNAAISWRWGVTGDLNRTNICNPFHQISTKQMTWCEWTIPHIRQMPACCWGQPHRPPPTWEERGEGDRHKILGSKLWGIITMCTWMTYNIQATHFLHLFI